MCNNNLACIQLRSKDGSGFAGKRALTKLPFVFNSNESLECDPAANTEESETRTLEIWLVFLLFHLVFAKLVLKGDKKISGSLSLSLSFCLLLVFNFVIK